MRENMNKYNHYMVKFGRYTVKRIVSYKGNGIVSNTGKSYCIYGCSLTYNPPPLENIHVTFLFLELYQKELPIIIF